MSEKKREILVKNDIDRLLEGMNKLADIVGSTLGPDGHIVYFSYNGAPISTKDGVTVARLVSFDDAAQSMGAGIIRQAAHKVAEETGDGTTTATILAREFIVSGIKAVKKGANRRHVGNGISKAAKQVSDRILNLSKKIEANDNEVRNVAYISSNSDAEIADLISEAIKKLGREGLIQIATSHQPKTYVEYIAGMLVNTSYTSPAFINTEFGDVRLKNVAVILHDEDILRIHDFMHFFHHFDTHKPFTRSDGEQMRIGGYLLIGRSIDGEAHGTLVKSKMEKNLPVLAAKAPYGLDFVEQLRDIAVMTGGKLIAAADGFSMTECAPPAVIGLCDEIICNEKGLWIIGGKHREQEKNERVELLKNQYEKEENQVKKKVLEERIAKLQNGIAKIYVGGENESRMHERAYRVEDAICAVKSSMKEGIVPGAGTAYMRCSDSIKIECDHPDELIGVEIVKKALIKPLEQILINSGFERDRRWFLQRLFGKKKTNDLDKMIAFIRSLRGNLGYNARTKQFEDLMAAGVIDPAMTERSSLMHAAAVAQEFLATGGAIINHDSHEELLKYNK